MTDEEYVALHQALDRISPPHPSRSGDELMHWIGRGAQIKRKDRAEWARLVDLRCRCRYCGENPEFYMLQREGLWDTVAPKTVLGYQCSSGNVCIACLAERAPGYRLFREDFIAANPDGPDDDYTPNGAAEFTKADGEEAEVDYQIQFPGRDEPAGAVSVETQFVGNGEWTEADWDEGYNVLFDHTAWLDDYCRALGLKLFIDGGEMDLSAPATEDPASNPSHHPGN